MKNTILSLFFLLWILASSFSQDNRHIIKFFPAGLINKVKASYENPINEDVTWGGLFSYYYGGPNNEFMGVKIEPALRLYTGKTPGLGFYLQMKIGGGYFNQDQTIYIEDNIFNPEGEQIGSRDYERQQTQDFAVVGGGMAIGAQFAVNNKKNLLIDLELGVQYYPKNIDYSRMYVYEEPDGTIHRISETDESPYPAMFEPGWYFIGPGAIFNPSLSIGYRF